MKKLFFKMIAMSLFLAIVSCQSNDDLNDLKAEEMSITQFFDKVSSMELQTSKKNVIYIEYSYDKENETIEYLQSKEKEFPYPIYLSGKTAKAEGYTVSCEMGGTGSDNWSEDCSSAWKCGKLAKKCLDAGGCATVCAAQMAYLPDSKEFIILDSTEFINFEE
ncbi:hypothetical protein H3Z83_09625 [Tenacibaculum sp. S7007]|uniref:Lipoprotein n=1 Tax=Tenacibaculum pelagium TaxID=2759527 RepID=A0A839ANV2_9FLAO|nr:hypothetical protein [Tenacibaculum pelagium]MBA6156773.1 hypothetical protein [Tenacibaculum pelagium]